jgi:hypothetical protein
VSSDNDDNIKSLSSIMDAVCQQYGIPLCEEEANVPPPSDWQGTPTSNNTKIDKDKDHG